MKAKFVYKGGKGSGHFNHLGRPGKQGGSIKRAGTYASNLTTLYHGTAAQFADSIRKNGLKGSGGVYATNSIAIALSYAKDVARSHSDKLGRFDTPIKTVCLVEVDKDYFKEHGPSYLSDGDVPPTGIKALHFYKVEDIKNAQSMYGSTEEERYGKIRPIRTISMKESTDTLYVPVVLLSDI